MRAQPPVRHVLLTHTSTLLAPPLRLLVSLVLTAQALAPALQRVSALRARPRRVPLLRFLARSVLLATIALQKTLHARPAQPVLAQMLKAPDLYLHVQIASLAIGVLKAKLSVPRVLLARIRLLFAPQRKQLAGLVCLEAIVLLRLQFARHALRIRSTLRPVQGIDPPV
jgi:hypothetical protein